MVINEYREGQEAWFAIEGLVAVKGIIGCRYLAPHVPGYYFITVASHLNPAITREYACSTNILFENKEDLEKYFASWEERNGKWGR